MHTNKEKDDVEAGSHDFYYKMACAKCVAKAEHVEEWKAPRLIKKRDHQTAKMTDRVMQFQIAQVQVKQIWSFLE
eukprot:8362909-Alexandrium_andersonii.AAC.1